MRVRFILAAFALLIAVFFVFSLCSLAAGSEYVKYTYQYPASEFTWIMRFVSPPIDEFREYPTNVNGSVSIYAGDILNGQASAIGDLTSTIRYDFNGWKVPEGTFEWISILFRVQVLDDSANVTSGYNIQFHRVDQIRVLMNGTWSTLPASEWVYTLYDANGTEIVDWNVSATDIKYPYYFNLQINRGVLLSDLELVEIDFAGTYQEVSDTVSFEIQCSPVTVEWSMVQPSDDAILDQIKDFENNLNTVPPDIQDDIDSERQEFEDFNSNMQDVIGPPADLEGLFELPTGLLDTLVVRSVFDFFLSYPVISGFFMASVCLSVVFFILRR